MRRGMTLGAVLFAFLLPAVARGQGLLVVVDPAQQVRLPRPIIIWPPRPYPRPIPPPEPPPVSYKIDTLEVDARVTDQVAKVQVSQSFVNTGSRQMEVAFIFPLPYDGAIDRMTLLVDGKEMPAKLLGRRRRPAGLRRDRAEEPRPGLAGVDRHGHVQDERLPGAAGGQADRFAPLRAALPQAGRNDRFPLPLEHGQVHVAAGREDQLPRLRGKPGGDQERLQPDARRRDQAARRPPCRGQLHGARTRFPPPISACSTTSAAAR